MHEDEFHSLAAWARPYYPEVGGEPPTSDFIAWVWMNRPEPDWSRHSRE